MTHRLKTVQPFFDDVLSGKKTFEVRKDDRNFQVGDAIQLFEGAEPIDETRIWSRNHLNRFITYKLEGGQYGIEEGYCILGISTDEP